MNIRTRSRAYRLTIALRESSPTMFKTGGRTMKRILISLALLLLFAGPLTLVGGQHLWAQGPGPDMPQGSIPRHRVGHRAKVQNLDILLAQDQAQGQPTDPLAGNHRLLEWDEIVLLGGGISENFWRVFDVNASLDQLDPKVGGPLAGDFPVDVKTGDFNGDGRSDVVLTWLDANNNIIMGMRSIDRDLQHAEGPTVDTGDRVPAPGGYIGVRVATGDFDADYDDEIVMAWTGTDRQVHLKVFDTQGGLTPSARGTISDEGIAPGQGFPLGIAAGDFNGDGDDEIVLVWRSAGDTLNVKVYDVDRQGALYPEAKWQYPNCLARYVLVAVASGDFNVDGIDEIVVGAAVSMSSYETGAELRVFQVTDNLHTLTLRNAKTDGPGRTALYDLIVAAGDFNTDGMDEIAFAVTWPQGGTLPQQASVSVFATHIVADSWELQKKAGIRDEVVPFGLPALSIAVGDLNRDLRAEIAMAWTPDWQSVNVKVYQVSTDLGSITAKGKQTLALPDEGVAAVAVAVGNLDGDSVRVGPPRYFNVVDAEQLIAVINEPPKHYDIINGTTYDVNNNPDTYARYEDEHHASTEMGLTTKRDWGLSSEVGLDIRETIDFSLKASYGESFEKATTSFKEMAFGQTAYAKSDDVIMRIETDYEIWEYPVYSDSTDAVQGHLLVAFPRKRDPHCSSNCEANVTARIDGKDTHSFYVPDHENHNLLSYSQNPPSDVGTLIKADTRNYVGANPYEMWVSWSDVQTDENKKSSNLDTKVGAGVHRWGIKIGVEGTYSQGEVSTQKVDFKSSTALHVYFDPISPRYSYWVEPYIYWSKDDGHLVLDYRAGPSLADPGYPHTWWQDTYTKTDLAFNLPWKYDPAPPSEAYRLFSKEVAFEPDSAQVGDQVAATAKVRNYSLLGVDDVTVRFYVGDPAAGGVQIGSDYTITHLNPMSSATAEIRFQAPAPVSPSHELHIYAVVDPDNHFDEMHKDNNKAYAILPILPEISAPGPLATLVIVPEQITFAPETPTLGETVHLSATIQAVGKTFTWVTVEFWDGNPRRGGELLGGELIPIIVAEETATAHVVWDTAGKYGNHDVWVGIDCHPEKEDITTDNWARKTISLPLVEIYLPIIFKE
jgi:hypothetical protein